MVAKVRHDNSSEQSTFLMNTILILQFLTTAILYLLETANFQEDYYLKNILYFGKYTDFNADWYEGYGAVLIKTQIISVFMPIVDFFIEFTIK
jgi:hypothetical protein